MSPLHQLNREQLVSAPLAEVWDFLKNPANLNSITPPDLEFSIISRVPPVMYDGLIIDYRIRIPCLGVHQWVAEIKHIRERHSFVDEQRVGPYAFWYHYHELQEDIAGVKIIDRVFYKVPWSLLGMLLHGVYIRGTLERIFAYRQDALQKIFNT